MNSTQHSPVLQGYSPVSGEEEQSLSTNRERFDAELRRAGWLQPTAVFGVDGLGAEAEAVIDGLNRLIRKRAQQREHPAGLHRRRFPAVNGLGLLERTDYVASFPQLLAALETFQGGQREHRKILADLAAGQDWSGGLEPNGMSLIPAACHPLYHSLAGGQARGEVYELIGDCFRAEPSSDPMRLTSFRMHELVILGQPEQCRRHRDGWIEEATGLLTDLGLQVEVVTANDPFFGRAGSLLADGQRDAELKFEIVTQVYPGHPTAIASGNCHEDHFGKNFEISLPEGGPAHSACFGFGLERIMLALAARHGLAVERWPQDVRDLLDL